MILGISNQAQAGAEHTTDTESNDKNMNFRIVTDTTPSIRDDGESTADHSKYESLEGPFENGPE
ncbi:MAG: hypothetical protein PVF13_04540, partial [Chromatiales bacterium]